MVVGIKSNKQVQKLYYEKSQKSIQYALSKILQSEISPYLESIYLYGSCVRGDQDYNSDVDLFAVLSKDTDLDSLKDAILFLKGDVIPPETRMPEVDLKIVVGGDWESSKMLYYQNVKKEGVKIWGKQ